MAPELKDTLFKNKPTELLALKLGTIIVELIRLLEISSPKELAGVIAEMGLKHIEYGLEGWHEQPFKAAMVATMKKVVTSRGHKWHTKTSRAWNWALTEIIVYLLEAVNIGRPKIETLNKCAATIRPFNSTRSLLKHESVPWLYLCTHPIIGSDALFVVVQ
jgi:hypothetical protein